MPTRMETMFSKQNDWQAARLGKFTASDIHKLLKSGKKKGEIFGDTAKTYINQKIAEIITGEPTSDLTGIKALEWGKAHEFDAVRTFEEVYMWTVEYFGGENPKFFPFNEFSGGSPDGLTNFGIVEIKCPYTSSTHIDNLLAAKRKEGNAWLKENRPEYYAQMQFNMMCCDKLMGFFVSYDPRTIDYDHRIAAIAINADKDVQNDIKHRISEACKIVSESLELLTSPSIILAHHDSEVNATIIEPGS